MSAPTRSFAEIAKRGQESVAVVVRIWADVAQTSVKVIATRPTELLDGKAVGYFFDVANQVLDGQRALLRALTSAEDGAWAVATRTSNAVAETSAAELGAVADIAEAPEVVDAPAVAKVPEVVEAHEVVKALEVVNALAVAEAPEVVKAPEVPMALEVAEMPKAAKAPGVVKRPKVAEKLQVVKAPEVVEAAEVAETPKATKKPEVAIKPEAAKTPEAPAKPKVAKTPEAAKRPKKPGSPGVAEGPHGKGSHAPLADRSEIPAGFPIKGNVGSRLYHVPGSSFYKRTVAEVWFATPQVAEAAGFRLPASQR